MGFIISLLVFFVVLGFLIKHINVVLGVILLPWLVLLIIFFGFPLAVGGVLHWLSRPRVLWRLSSVVFSLIAVGVMISGCFDFRYYIPSDLLNFGDYQYRLRFNELDNLFTFEYGKYLLAVISAFMIWGTLNQLNSSKELSENKALYDDKAKEVMVGSAYGLGLIVVSVTDLSPMILIQWVTDIFDPLESLVSGIFPFVYWLIGGLVMLGVVVDARKLAKETVRLDAEIDNTSGHLKSQLIAHHLEESEYSKAKEYVPIFDGILLKRILAGAIKEIGSGDDPRLYLSNDVTKRMNGIKYELAREHRFDESDYYQVLQRWMKMTPAEIYEFSESYDDFGRFRYFDDGKYFVPVSSKGVVSCEVCGLAELEEENGEDWYCSDICRETESICDDIKLQDPETFIDSAVATGFVLMAGQSAWVNNHKMFAAGGQGHGFAAESANNMIDRLKGKDATVIGGDNAKYGADRLVDGQSIQTKYYSTGNRSAGAAFNGSNGNYKYLAADGSAMSLEVPKDQYDQAVKYMEKKIAQGKVPGYSNPEDAKNLVVKGNVTYDQARNITRFGTLESVAFDVAEGAVVGFGAAGISFGITAVLCFAQSGDKKKAIEAAMVGAGKTFLTTTGSYVATQQLHRLESVQAVLKNIDVEHLSPTFRSFLEKGAGVSGKAATNSALRGTVVTSVVVLAASTGPDLVKFARGRISPAQLGKNVTVATSGVAGGVAGSFIGGAVCTPLGPAGMIAGRVVGGMVGSAVSSLISKHITKKFGEDDCELVLRMISEQIEYLTGSFMLNAHEIENLNENLQKVLTQDAIETIFAAKHERRAAANFVVMPIVVGIVKQRAALNTSEFISPVMERLPDLRGVA